MLAVSKKQQKFFGIVRAIQKGEMAPTTPETAEVAASMKKKDVKDLASTKHRGLPEKKKVEEGVGLAVARAIDSTKPPLGRTSLRRSVSSALKMGAVKNSMEKRRKSFKDFTKDVEAAKNKK
jgi:hypothetical protein